MQRRIITTENIIRVETNDGRSEDFPNEGDRYSGGVYQSNQYIRDAQVNDLEPKIYKGTVTTDLELTEL